MVPARQKSSLAWTVSTKGKPAWNKGLTKKTSASVARVARKKRAWWAAGDRRETRRKIGAKSKGRIKGGPLHPSWKGGRIKCKRDGYVRVYSPGHPFAVSNTKGGGKYVLEHRLVMEKVLGRYLHPDEDVNHRNGVKDDNRPENLRLVSHFAHFEEHGCPNCGFKFLTK